MGGLFFDPVRYFDPGGHFLGGIKKKKGGVLTCTHTHTRTHAHMHTHARTRADTRIAHPSARLVSIRAPRSEYTIAHALQ
jgi:uncharacterized protein (DUF2141 family)